MHEEDVKLIALDPETEAQNNARLNLLFEIGRIVASQETMNEAAPQILEAICRRLRFELGELWCLGKGETVLHLESVWHLPDALLEEFVAESYQYEFSVGMGLPGKVWAKNAPVWIENLSGEDEMPRHLFAETTGFQSGFAFPILLGDKFLGTFSFFTCERRQPDDALLQMFAAVGDNIGQFVKRERIESHLRAAEDRYRAFIEQSTEGIWRFELDEKFRVNLPVEEQVELAFQRGYLAECNDAMARMYGLERAEDLVGSRIADLLDMNDAANVAYIRSFIESGYSLTDAESHEKDVEGKDKFFLNSLVGTIENDYLVRVWGTQRDITGQKRAEEATRESEANFRQLAEAVPQFVWVTEVDGSLSYVNEQWLEFSGLTFEQTNDAQTMAHVFHPDDVERLTNEWEKAFSNGEVLEIELRMRNRQGEYRWFLTRSRPVKDAGGKILKWFGTSTDITDGKRAESRLALLAEISELTRTLEDPDELLFAVSQAVGEHLQVKRCLFNEIDLERDRETVHRDYCRGVESVAGEHRISDYSSVTSAAMTAGKTVVNRDSKTDPRTAHDYAAAYEPNGERAYITVPLLRENRWVASLWVSDDVPRQWSGQEISLLETIAERTWTAIEKLRINVALRESREVLSLAMSSSRMGAWSRNLANEEVYWSAELEEIFGLQAGSFAGNINGFYDYVYAEDKEYLAAEVRNALSERRDYIVEFRFHHADGSLRWMEGRGQAVYAPDGTPTKVYGIGIDITERKQTEAERERLLVSEQQARETAEEANRAKDEFIALVSHELRSPLNAMLGWTRILQNQNPDEKTKQYALDVITRNARSQSRLIEDLLDIARVSKGKLRLEMEPTELIPIINDVVEIIRPAAEAGKINLNQMLDRTANFITGDVDRLRQVIENLLSNAVKFTPPGGSVEIRLERDKTDAKIIVSDTGQGISPEFLPQIFERFKQADPSTTRRHGGLGIGLSLARDLVELHGGTISAQSAGEGEGTIFTVTLPLRTVAPIKENSDEVEFMDARGKLSGFWILAVDDEADARELVSFMLQINGAKVTTANSAVEALEILKDSNGRLPDVLLSDISMPNESGYALLEKIRSLPREHGGQIPAVALTAFNRPEDREAAFDAGFQKHLGKPVEPDDLISAIIETANK